MPAFEHAVDLGYRYLETDVHVTADGVVVAFHDDDLSRTCGRPGRISRAAVAEVATARVDGREPIPRLDDLLDAFPDAARQHRLQDRRARSARWATSSSARRASSTGCASASFSDRRLRRLRQRFGPRLCTQRRPGRARPCCGSSASPRPACCAAQVPVAMQGVTVVTDAGFVRRCHRRGIEVHVWTIDDAGRDGPRCSTSASTAS